MSKHNICHNKITVCMEFYYINLIIKLAIGRECVGYCTGPYLVMTLSSQKSGNVVNSICMYCSEFIATSDSEK